MIMRHLPLVLMLALHSGLHAASPESTVLLEGEDFQFGGNWLPQPESSASDGKILQTTGSPSDALTVIRIPAAGRYHIWTRSRDFANDPAKRFYRVVIDGEPVDLESGKHGTEGWAWEKVGERDLEAGKHVIGLRDTARYYGRCDAILLTTSDLDPAEAKLAGLAKYRITPEEVTGSETDVFPASPELADGPVRKVAEIANDQVRLVFSEAKDREGRPVIVRDTELKLAEGWKKVPVEAREKLFLLSTPKAELTTSAYFPFWSDGAVVRFQNNGKTYESRGGRNPFTAAEAELLVPRSARQIDANTVELSCESAAGLKAVCRWTLRPGRDDAQVKLTFTAPEAGFYSVGFSPFQPWSEDKVDFNLLSPLYQSSRRPKRPLLLPNAMTPHPLALVQLTPAGMEEKVSFSVIADPENIPYEWPNPKNSRYGFSLLNENGEIQPSIFSPILGFKDSQMAKGEAKTVSWSVLARPGDWKESLGYASEKIFGVTDYREPQGVSLTDAALNMVDLMKNEEFGGWNSRLMGFYNIESLDTVTNAAPLAVLSASIITEDEELYKTRGLPSLAFLLSRPSAHFATSVPKSEPAYVNEAAAKLGGPTKFYGTSVWQGAHELLGGRNAWLAEFALEGGKARHSTAYNSMPYWSEMLAAYRLNNDPAMLEKVRVEADKFLDSAIYGKHFGDLGIVPFYNISYYPYWWSLPELYEATGDKKYLAAAEEGASYTIAGQWSQPVIPKGDATIYKNNEFQPDYKPRIWWKGGKEYRLGWPLAPGALTEKKVPAWVVSQVGLGLEQPSTYFGGGNNGFGNILMSSWAPNLLRVAAYTGKDIYRTYARNAVIGRFANYPGYYMRGYTDVVLDPKFPEKGPDLTSIYYHHIPPQLAFTLDYIVTDAELRSKGKIRFPYGKQEGYVWFANRVFGGKPGQVYDDKDMRLWIDRGAFHAGPETDYFGARGPERFALVLLNQTPKAVAAGVTIDAEKTGILPDAPWRLIVNGEARDMTLPFDGKVELPPNGLAVLSFPAKRSALPDIPVLETKPVVQKIGGEWGDLKAYRIRSPFANDSIYVFVTGHPESGALARMNIKDSAEPALEAPAFPHEFIVHPWPMDKDFSFTLSLRDAEGKETVTPPVVLPGTPK